MQSIRSGTLKKQLDFSIVRDDELFLQNWVVEIVSQKSFGYVVHLCHYRTMRRDASYLKWKTVDKYDSPNKHNSNTLRTDQIRIPKALIHHLETKLQAPVEILKY